MTPRIFRLPNGRHVDLWAADEWATRRGLHVDMVWPDECERLERLMRAADEPLRRSDQLGDEERRHILVLTETGHDAAEVAALFNLDPFVVRSIDAERRWAREGVAA